MTVEQMILQSPDLQVVIGEYLFIVKCRGRKGIVAGTHMAETFERAFKHFYLYQ